MSDIYLDVLQNYLNGQEWRDSIEIFVGANCHVFEDIQEMSHGQYDIWKTFQEIVENILEMALVCVGGNMSSLEKELEYIIKHKEARGPRDAAIRDVLEQLLSFEDFHSFATMMNRAYQAHAKEFTVYSGESTPPPLRTAPQPSTSSRGPSAVETRLQQNQEQNYQALYEMGYEADDIRRVMRENDPGIGLHDLQMKLSEYLEIKHHQRHPSKKPTPAHEEYAYDPKDFGEDIYSGEAKYGESKHSEAKQMQEPSYSPDPNFEGQWEDASQIKDDTIPVSKMKASPAVQSFATAAGISDPAELVAKFAMAESIKDTFDSITENSSEAMFKLVKWAGDMLTLRADIELAAVERVPFQDIREHYRWGLLEWYADLETKRKENGSVLGGNIISDEEITRMVELDNIAMLGTEDEQYLHHILTRHDTVSRDCKAIYFKINMLVNSDRHLTREAIEELYVHLKEQVANDVDLDLIVDDLYEFISSRISSANNNEVVSLLLDLHILEDEQDMLKRKIQSLAGGDSPSRPTDSGAAESKTDDGISRMREFFDADARDGGGISLGQIGVSAAAESKHSGDDVRSSQQSKGSKGDYEGDIKQSGSSSSAAVMAESKGTPLVINVPESKQQGGLASALSPVPEYGVETAGAFGVASQNDAYLNSLKDKHKSCLANLKSSLEAEKTKALKDLEDKLQRRKQKIKKLMGSGDAMDTERQALLELQQKELMVITDQMEDTKKKFDIMITNMVSGYRKKCLGEIKAARKQAAEGRSGAVVSLSEEELEQNQKEISAQLLARFERDTQSLLDRIETDRLKQRNKLLLKLAQKKAEYNVNVVGGEGKAMARFEEQTTREIDQLNSLTADQVAQVLLETQTNVLNTLSAIAIDDSLLIGQKVHNDEDDDEAYLNEGAHTNQKLGAWLDRLTSIQDNYLNASKQIQYKLNYVNHSNILAQDEAITNIIKNANYQETLANIEDLEKNNPLDSEDSTYSNVTSHMMKVLVDAYSSQINTDASLNKLAKGDKKRRNSNDSVGSTERDTKSVRVKEREKQEDTSNIRKAILSEFERTKGEYTNVMNESKKNSKQRLIERRNQSRAAAANGRDINSVNAVPTLATYESLVDSFLENPLSSEKEYKQQTTEIAGMSPVPASSSSGPLFSREGEAGGNAILKRNNRKDADDDYDKEDRDRIKNQHAEKEKQLTDDLYANMLTKKKKLEDRLHKKREEAERASKRQQDHFRGSYDEEEDNSITAQALDRQEQEARNNITAIEKAFETIQSMLQNATKEELNQYDLKTLVHMMDGKIEDATAKNDVQTAVGTTSAAVNSIGHSFSAAPPTVTMDKEELEAQAKRLAFSYTEENQKLDLRMKIEETRTRQNLQRKLMEKKQNQNKQQQQQQVNASLPALKPLPNAGLGSLRQMSGTGFSSNMTMNEINAMRTPQKVLPVGGAVVEDSILSSSGSKSSLTPTNLQPAFKGLEATNNLVNKSTSGGMSGMASRGLNLGPMQRK